MEVISSWLRGYRGILSLCSSVAESSYLVYLIVQINTWMNDHLYTHQAKFYKTSKGSWWGTFPGGPMVKNLSCSAGDLDSMPGQGTETPHGSEQPSLCTTTRESIFWKILQDSNKDSLMLQLRTLEWVAISFSRGSSQPRNWTLISHIAGRFFTVWAIREALRQNAAKLINVF